MAKAVLCLNYTHRVQDNPLLTFCASEKIDIIPCVFFSEEQIKALGAAEKLWLHHSLEDLDSSLDGNLIICQSEEDLTKLVKKEDPEYFLYSFISDTRVSHDFPELLSANSKMEVMEFSANNIFDFEDVKNKSGTAFKVFTPFYKHCLTKTKTFIVDQLKNQLTKDIKKHVNILSLKSPSKLSDLKLLGSKAKWNKTWQESMCEYWNISEAASIDITNAFADSQVLDYPENRDIPSNSGTSKLSPYLHFGMVSPFRIWFEVEQRKNHDKNKKASVINKDIKDSNGYDAYLRQLCWREFAQYILYHFPKSSHSNLNAKYDNFPWKKNKKALEAWQKGMTGYPIVDAGMRELYETGWMHNRVRMVVGSFLVKDLMIHWIEGAKWFEDTLFDADLANNSMGWQWVAGSGVDASPFYRIFNPMTQSEKFDKNAKYIRKWIPELKDMDDKWIHRPFEAPEMILDAAGVILGKTYPKPLVNHDSARKEALAANKALSQ